MCNVDTTTLQGIFWYKNDENQFKGSDWKEADVSNPISF